MAYVDLNPIRAGMCSSLETSDFTSIKQRINQIKSYQHHQDKSKDTDYTVPQQPNDLLPFSGVVDTHAIPFALQDYVELVEWSGRHVDRNKTGFITSHEPNLLLSLNIEPEDWLESVKNFRRHYGNFAGSEQQLRRCAHRHGQSWYKGVG